jgi:uncharacterized protein
MTRASVAALCIALLAAPALAQDGVPTQPRTDFEDLRPKEWQFDNLKMEELPIGIAPEAPGVSPLEQALTVSNDVFGPRVRVDPAYGAFQRGYFLTALRLALPRAEADDSAAQTLIAELYAKGLGVGQNFATASGWYALASRNGDWRASFELALMYQEGSGVPRNRQRAAELFALAVEQGSVVAKYNLALLHIEGIYAEPSLVEAARLMREAAEAGIPEAQYDYGTMLIEGAGVAPNPGEGASWTGKAAEQGLAEAQVDYATMLYLGRGVAVDRVAAIKWYARAAGAGNAVAQNRYAKLLAAGEGIDTDLQTAAMWRALARRQGLTDPQLDKLLASIPPDDLSRAEERARYWPDAPPATVAEAAVTDAGPPTQN